MIRIIVSALFLAIGLAAAAQVSVTTDGSAPVPSAMLEVKSNAKGFLPPRMTRAEMLAIPSPVDGLTVYCTNCSASGSLAMYSGGKWNTLNSTCLVPLPPAAGTGTVTSSTITWTWTPVTDATSYYWNSLPSTNGAIDVGNVTSHQETGLNCSTNYTSYVWAYNNCGLSTAVVLNQATSANPPAATAGASSSTPTTITWNWNAAPGATGYRIGTTAVYANAINVGNVTSYTESGLNCNQTYNRYLWAYNTCGNSGYKILSIATGTAPSAPVIATHVPTSSSVTWNWTAVTGATGYKWNTVNSYSSATDLGNVTSFTETGLACSTTYFRYFWAYTSCGNSTGTSTSQKTAIYPAAPEAGTNTPAVTQITWNWTAVPGVTGYKWNTANNYGTATNLGNVLSKVETGLTCNTPYARYVWAYNSCGASISFTLRDTTLMSGVPAAPVSGTHTSTSQQVVWNWNAVAGALGYKWNTENDYSTATDMGTALTKTEPGLTCATTYNRYVWAYTTCGVSPATTLTKATVWCLWLCGMPITDSRDSKVYSTVAIGTQCWMAQNLNVGGMINTSSQQQPGAYITKYCMNNQLSNCDVYGGWYTWGELMDYTPSSSSNPSGRQGICPTGWHIPSDDEWCELETYLDSWVQCVGEHISGQDCGGKMKETGTGHWTTPNTGATNSSGFTGLPAGIIYNTMVGGFLESGYFASSTEDTTGTAWLHVLYYDYQMVGHVLRDHYYARSVRCVRD